MPGLDGTGPMGMGPMTGGGRGFCALPVSCLRPRLLGRGGGRGWRNWYYATGLPGWVRAGYSYPAFGGWANSYGAAITAKAEETEMLKEQAEFLKARLEDVRQRISSLEKANQG